MHVVRPVFINLMSPFSSDENAFSSYSITPVDERYAAAAREGTRRGQRGDAEGKRVERDSRGGGGGQFAGEGGGGETTVFSSGMFSPANSVLSPSSSAQSVGSVCCPPPRTPSGSQGTGTRDPRTPVGTPGSGSQNQQLYQQLLLQRSGAAGAAGAAGHSFADAVVDLVGKARQIARSERIDRMLGYRRQSSELVDASLLVRSRRFRSRFAAEQAARQRRLLPSIPHVTRHRMHPWQKHEQQKQREENDSAHHYDSASASAASASAAQSSRFQKSTEMQHQSQLTASRNAAEEDDRDVYAEIEAAAPPPKKNALASTGSLRSSAASEDTIDVPVAGVSPSTRHKQSPSQPQPQNVDSQLVAHDVSTAPIPMQMQMHESPSRSLSLSLSASASVALQSLSATPSDESLGALAEEREDEDLNPNEDDEEEADPDVHERPRPGCVSPPLTELSPLSECVYENTTPPRHQDAGAELVQKAPMPLPVPKWAMKRGENDEDDAAHLYESPTHLTSPSPARRLVGPSPSQFGLERLSPTQRAGPRSLSPVAPCACSVSVSYNSPKRKAQSLAGCKLQTSSARKNRLRSSFAVPDDRENATANANAGQGTRRLLPSIPPVALRPPAASAATDSLSHRSVPVGRMTSDQAHVVATASGASRARSPRHASSSASFAQPLQVFRSAQEKLPRGRHLSSSGSGILQRPYAHRQQPLTWTPPTRSRQHYEYEYEYERRGDDEDRLHGERGGGVGSGGQNRGRRPPLKRHRSDDRERVLDRDILSRFDPPSRPLPVSTTPPASGDSDDTDSQDWA